MAPVLGRHRRRHRDPSPELRADRCAHEVWVSRNKLARDFEPSAHVIRYWLAHAGRDEGTRTDGLTTEEREELRRLRRENKVLREEKEIQEEAAAWFAKETGSVPKASSSWAMSTSLATDVVLVALNMAVAQRKPKSVIHHSDHGCQYTSLAFGRRCREVAVRPSRGSVGDAYDNAMCESFFASLECELVDRTRLHTQAYAKMAVFKCIEGFSEDPPLSSEH